MNKKNSSCLARILVAMMLVLAGCTKDERGVDDLVQAQNSEPDVVTAETNKDEPWSEEKIRKVFASRDQTNDLEIVECRSVADFAFERVGTILYADRKKETTNVAFMDRDGYFQTCGISAALYSEPEFTYIGNGVVTFKLQTADGSPYNCKVSFTKENADVGFVVEDDYFGNGNTVTK